MSFSFFSPRLWQVEFRDQFSFLGNRARSVSTGLDQQIELKETEFRHCFYMCTLYCCEGRKLDNSLGYYVTFVK